MLTILPMTMLIINRSTVTNKVTCRLAVARCLLLNVDLQVTRAHDHANVSVTITTLITTLLIMVDIILVTRRQYDPVPNAAHIADNALRIVCFNRLLPDCFFRLYDS